ncbi:hypothetical protein [Mycobacterium timonense]|uniref:hypothetical protein n=1 Tax=Mycobacterium timonense TaxID=701043 RepID=UPI001150DCE2|nr:hypothetical protein [Mycobacterium timonense]
MKYISDESGRRVVELTQRNLLVLLAKLDVPLSSQALIDGEGRILVRAIENEARPDDATARARLSEGVVELTRSDIETLLAALSHPGQDATLVRGGSEIVVRAVENTEHYRDRPPGRVWMPSSGQEL